MKKSPSAFPTGCRLAVKTRARSGRQTSATRADARELFDRMPDRILPDSLTDRPPTPGFNRRRRPKRMRMPRTKQKMQLFRTPPGMYHCACPFHPAPPSSLLYCYWHFTTIVSTPSHEEQQFSINFSYRSGILHSFLSFFPLLPLRSKENLLWM